MPTFNIIKTAEPKKTFRVASIMGKFDLESNQIKEHFEGNIDIKDNFNQTLNNYIKIMVKKFFIKLIKT